MYKEEVFIEPETYVEDYVIERNKPMPNALHSKLESDIVFQLRIKYDEQFDFLPELSLKIEPGATPDICIYPKRQAFVRSEIKAKETEMPLTTIEILSPSQSIEKMAEKIRDDYFPAGIKSAWIVVPAFKAIHLMLPGDQNLYFDKGELTDPATGIQLSIEKLFERVV
jgi:Uma2 family endonuclease